MKNLWISKKGFSILIFLLILPAFLFAGGGREAYRRDKTGGAPRGGLLKAVVPSNPTTLDIHFTSSDLVWKIAWHIFEPIITLDREGNPAPMLAEYKLEEGGKKIVLKLRKGIKFHNGKTMNSEDVAASLGRWLNYSSLAKESFKAMESISITDPYTVAITFKEYTAEALAVLASQEQGAYIMPKEVIDSAKGGEIKEYIGTGPYRFAEWIPDSHIRLVRFEDYTPLTGGPDGYGGTKYAYLDEILFIPVSDKKDRMAGIIAGDYDYSIISPEQLPQIKTNPDLEAVSVPSGEMACMVFNLKKGNLTDKLLRQAVLTSLNIGGIMTAAFSDPLFYNIHPSWMPRGSAFWNDVGSDVYNKRDLEKAKRLMQEAGYKGEEILWVTTSDFSYLYQNALSAASQLEEAGFNINLQVVDLATLSHIRINPEAYDIVSFSLTLKADPVMIAFMGTNWPGWYDTPRKNEYINKFKAERDPKKRIELWREMSKVIYDEVPAITFGEIRSAAVFSKRLKGFNPGMYPFFWNSWIEN